MKRIDDLYKDFEEGLKKVAEKVISDYIAHYLPYAEDDLEANVWHRSRDIIKAFLAGDEEYAGIRLSDVMKDYDAEKVRQKLFEEHKEELVELVNQDNLRKIEMLESRIRYLAKARW